MSFLSKVAGLAAPFVGNMIAPGVGGVVGGMLGGLLGDSSSPAGTQSATTQNKLDPRVDAMLFGSQDGSSKGLLSRYQSMLDTPQSDAMKSYGAGNSDYLTRFSGGDLSVARDAATKLIAGNNAPTMNAAQMNAAGVSGPSWAVGNMVDAPRQNNIDLSGAYNNMIYGDAAQNPYLTGAIQKGINQSTNAFGQMQQTATDNLMKTVLPSIRSNSVLAGQYGGSRQGVAEGNAIGDYAKAAQQAASQFGQNNTDAAVAAQAGAFDNGQNRALSAMQGLGAQQYGVASQNAATKNAAEFMNVGNVLDILKTNAGMQQSANQTNAALQQQANAANQQAQLQSNAQNSQGMLGGAGLLSGLLGGAANATNSFDNYDLSRAQGVNSLLTPYMSANSSSTTSQPLYQNNTGNMLGGAMLGKALFSGGGGSSNTSGGLLDLFGKGSFSYF